MRNKIVFGFLLFLGLMSCQQSDPEFTQREDDVITFSGRKWDIKTGFNGPGPNFFTNHPNDVFVDDNGYLHLFSDQDS